MKKILIVDDEASIRELYKYIFTDLGYEVETAKDGGEALGKAPLFKPDCMLIDILMPEMTGAELAEKLCASPAPGLKDIPFIVLTGENCADAALRRTFQENSSCKALMSKMSSPDSVAKMVQEVILTAQGG